MSLKIYIVSLILCLPVMSFAAKGTGGAACNGSVQKIFSCSPKIVVQGTQQNVTTTGQEAHRECVLAYAAAEKVEVESAGILAGIGSSIKGFFSDKGAENQAKGHATLSSDASMAHNATRAAFNSANAKCTAAAAKYESAVNTANAEILKAVSPEEMGHQKVCQSRIAQFTQSVEQAIRPCLIEIAKKEAENAGGAGISAGGAALALGAAGLVGAYSMGAFDGDDDEGGSGGGGSDGFTVSANDEGGQCIAYGKGQEQEKCYSNSDLSKICYKGDSTTSNPMTQFSNATQVAGTQKMEEALCKAFVADTREGAGGDENTCHTQKEGYFKEAACTSRMIAQCQTSEFGDCSSFNAFYCGSEDEGNAKGSNYCTYREASLYCESGASKMSPACAWLNQVANTTGESSSCMTNINQGACFPRAYKSRDELEQACTVLTVRDKDPLCKSMDNEKMYFSWRNPGIPGGGGEAPDNAGEGVEVSNNSCDQKPNVDCAQIQNRDTPMCIEYYCCQSKNSAAPICQSLAANSVGSTTAGGISTVATQNRYPAGSLPSDIITYRGESIFTSNSKNSAAHLLCTKGQLYDCGSLQGYVPR